MEKVILKQDETVEDLQYKGLIIIQNQKKYRFTQDAVVLANFVRANSGETVLDLGTGTAIIPILVASKTNASKIVGIDIQEDAIDMAKRSVQINGLSDKISLRHLNIKNCDIIGSNSFDIVVSNPPYFKVEQGATREAKEVAISRHEIEITLEEIICSASKMVKYGGKFYMVHKCCRMAEAIYLLEKYKLTPKVLNIIYAKASKAPDTFVVECKSCAKDNLIINSVVLFNEDGTITEQGRALCKGEICQNSI
ncbi:MAG: methyltransferase [Clostridia bacterium]